MKVYVVIKVSYSPSDGPFADEYRSIEGVYERKIDAEKIAKQEVISSWSPSYEIEEHVVFG